MLVSGWEWNRMNGAARYCVLTTGGCEFAFNDVSRKSETYQELAARASISDTIAFCLQRNDCDKLTY